MANVRILELNGKISDSEYELLDEKPDRKGLRSLRDFESGNVKKVHHRRVLHDSSPLESIVITVNDRHRAVCPNCYYYQDVKSDSRYIECPTHGQFTLKWKDGDKIMSKFQELCGTENCSTDDNCKNDCIDDNVNESMPVTDTTEVSENAQTQSLESILSTVRSDDNLELWTKKNIKFDHAKINVQAYVLIYNGENPRKLCFNTYDDRLGKKAKPLPIEEFVENKCSSERKPWYDLKNIETALSKLQKDGYERLDT